MSDYPDERSQNPYNPYSEKSQYEDWNAAEGLNQELKEKNKARMGLSAYTHGYQAGLQGHNEMSYNPYNSVSQWADYVNWGIGYNDGLQVADNESEEHIES